MMRRLRFPQLPADVEQRPPKTSCGQAGQPHCGSFLTCVHGNQQQLPFESTKRPLGLPVNHADCDLVRRPSRCASCGRRGRVRDTSGPAATAAAQRCASKSAVRPITNAIGWYNVHQAIFTRLQG